MTSLADTPSIESTPQKNVDKKQKKRNVKKRHKKKKTTSFSSYIYKILKQIHPNLGASKKAIIVIEQIIDDIFNRILEEAIQLTRQNKRETIGPREIQSATRLVLTGELAKHAVAEGVKAVTKYKAYEKAE